MPDTGSHGFMLVATSLVMLMTPGLALFYGGLVSRKNVLSIMIQSFVSMGWTTVLWWAVGYSLVFSGGEGGIIGNLDHAFMHGINYASVFHIDFDPNGTNTIPTLVHFVYQMMFAIITPALITGAFANRIKFKAYLVFLTAWMIFVYFPIAHMVWGNGLFAKVWGVLDFAGGTAVHASSGFAALASVIYVGRRKVDDRGLHNIPLVALGTALLWFGWYGFNAGSELKVDSVTFIAFVNTDVAASTAALTWLFTAWAFEKKPKFVGLLTGAVAGLVGITPAAGYVSIGAAVVIGILASAFCYLAVEFKNHVGLDDALDVWGVHGVGGFVGCLMTGVFASKYWNPAGADGLLHGNVHFFLAQFASVAITAGYSFLFTIGALWVINKVTAVRVSQQEEEEGLDTAIHGEAAYL